MFALGLVAMLSAQDGNRRERFPGRPQAPETVTLSGVMTVANGMPALESGNDTYLVGGISRLIGFVDGLKEGAQVTVEGSVMTIPGRNSLKYLRASKLTLGGKSYDLASPLGMGMDMMGMWNFGFNRNTPNLPNAPRPPSPPGGPMRNQGPQAPQRLNRR